MAVPLRQGATTTLLCHIAMSATQFRLLRQCSISPSYPVGGLQKGWLELPDHVQAGIEGHLKTMNADGGDPLNTKWSLKSIYELGGSSEWNNYALVLFCLTTLSTPPLNGSDLLLAAFFKRTEPRGYILTRSVPITPDFNLGQQSTYEALDLDARKAAKDHSDRLNLFEADLTRHPWAFHRSGRIVQYATKTSPLMVSGFWMVMQWQSGTSSAPHPLGATPQPSRSESSLATLPPQNQTDEHTLLPPYSQV